MKMALDRREKNISLFVECLLFLLAVLAVFFRMQRGVDITDETWYVAEPYLVSQGQLIPYVDNWTQSPGFSIPLAFFFGAENVTEYGSKLPAGARKEGLPGRGQRAPA